MRVAIDARFIQDHFPGIGRYTFNLARQLAEMGQDELIVLHNPALRNSHYDVAALRRFGRVKLVALCVSTLSLGEQWRVSMAALHEKADLLHSPYYVKPYLPPLPSVTTIYDVISARFPEYMPSRRARWLFGIAMRLAIGSSRRVLTISRSARDDILARYGIAPGKVSVSYLGVEERFRPLERAACAGLRERYQLPEHFALYVGINKPHKNLVQLIEAVALARKESDARLVIAGARDRRWPQVEQAVARLGLDEAVVFLTDVPDSELPSLYNLADCFAFPSLYEGFGLPPLEAMACGLPVICSNTSSLPEVVGDAGILLDPLDVPAWAEALSELWQSPARRATLSEKGREQAARFTWRQTAQRTRDAYEEALAS